MTNPLEMLINQPEEPTIDFVWATVTSVAPLAIRLDGDSTSLDGVPSTLVDPQTLSVSDRVYVVQNGRRVTVIGRGGGAVAPGTRPYAPLPEVQTVHYSGASGAITAAGAAWQNIASMPTIVTPPLPREMVARIDFGCMARYTTSAVYLMLGAALSGATALHPQALNYGSVATGQYGMFTPFSSGPVTNGSDPMTGWKMVKLQPGVTTITLQGMRPSTGASPEATYPTMTLTPLYWIDETPYEPEANWGNSMPPGTYIEYGGTDALDPLVWLPAEGQAVSRTTYARLFEKFGVQYGSGNGSTTFNLPDARGRTLVGLSSDTEFNTLGKKYGTKTHTLTTAEIPAHAHQQKFSLVGAPGSTMGAMASSGSGAQYNAEQTTLNTGGGGAHNNIQPSIVAKVYIKT